MAWTFQNGIITDGNGYSYDLNNYLRSVSTSGGGDTTGGIGALHSFYDDYAVKAGGATNPTNALLGGAVYSRDYNGNPANAAGQTLLPQIQNWWQQNYSGVKPPTTQMPTPSTGGTNSAGSQPATTAAPQQATANVWQTQPKPQNALSGRASTFGALTGQQPQQQQVSGYDPFRDGSMASLPTQTTALPVSSTATGRSVRDGAYAGTSNNRLAQFNAIQNFTPPNPPTQASQPGPYDSRIAEWWNSHRGDPSSWGQGTNGGQTGTGTGSGLGNYPGGRGNWQGYGPNGGGLRVDPSYLPENWNYQESPEYLWRQQQAERGLNRLLLNRGRSDSLGGINSLANLRSNIAADEVDKQYQRALNANMQNYSRYLGANVTNYGRTQQEDQTGWNRAWDVDNRDWTRQFALGEQDWNRNWQLANLGYNATNSGVQSGNATGLALANLLSSNGATQAALAVQRGSVSGATIQSLLNAGLTYMQIEQLFGGGGGAGTTPGTGTSNTSYASAMYGGGGATPGVDWFA